MATHYRVQTRPQRRHVNLPHLLAFVVAPVTVFLSAYALWTSLAEQCTELAASQCLAVGSTQLSGSDVALLATFLSAGIAAIVEVATH